MTAESTPPHAGRLVRVALVVTLVLFAAIAIGAAAHTAVADAENETVEEDVETHSIDELREGGQQVSGAAPSVRWIGSEGSVYIDYANPNPLVGGGGEDWEAGEILYPGERVQADSLTMHGQLDRESDGTDLELVIVYWEPGTEVVENDNGDTRTERVAQNQTIERQTVEFSGSFDQEAIDLRRSDEPREVTMWLEEPDTGEPIDGARWTFEHESIATTQSAGITSMGDLLTWVGTWIVAPLVVLTIGVGVGVRAILRKAGRGPDKGVVFWSVVVATTTTLAVAIAYVWLADILVALPLAIPVGLALFTGIVMLETWESGVERVEFIQPDLSDATSPSGDKALDIISVSSQFEDVVRTEPGQFAVVRSGIRPFLSRVFGGAAPLEGAGQLSTRFDVDGKHDAKIFVHPRAEKVLDYKPEGWTIDVPELETRDDQQRVAILAALTLAFAGSVGWTFGALWGTLALACAIAAATVRPTKGYARVDPAPAHTRAAFGSMLYLAREIDDAETIETARRKLVEKEARSEKDVEEALQQRDATLVSEMFNTDVDDAVSELNDDDASSLEDLFDHDDDRDDERGGVPVVADDD